MIQGRRTHSVHHTYAQAHQAAADLGRLLNGVPCGYAFAVLPRMGKFAFISAPVEAFRG